MQNLTDSALTSDIRLDDPITAIPEASVLIGSSTFWNLPFCKDSPQISI